VRHAAPYLRHILDAITAIQEYTTDGRESFLSDRKTQDAVVRNLEIVGEATRNVPAEFRSAHSDIPWQQAANLRNVLAHEYFGVDLRIVWAVVENELPPLKAKIQRLLEDIGDR
jgi:uncharacterized protein with HEPN domain